MKALFVTVAIISFGAIVRGQNSGTVLAQQAGQGVKEGAAVVTEKTGENLENKLLNKLFEKKKKKKGDTRENNSQSTGQSNQTQNTVQQGQPDATVSTTAAMTGNNSSTTQSFQAYSKFDFVPGDKVVVAEDFSQDAIGDFPDKWNTNSTGEVVTLNQDKTHWLSLKKQGRFIPEFITSLPDNFTLQFDLQVNPQMNDYSSALRIWMLSGGQSKNEFSGWFLNDEKRSGVAISVQPDNIWNHSGRGGISTYEDGSIVINGDGDAISFFKNMDKSKARVSVWRQKQRIRVYMDNEKIFDLPRAFADGKNYNFLMFELPGDMKNQDAYYISNITLAVGAPDTRNKLITEGKFVTRGILFDVNSDKIKPESYGALKDIANVLSENPTVKVKIVGHTDADGDAANNLALSQKRATSVKDALVNDFGIDASRLATDGKGATQPVDTNATPEGKANNRRVEFIKM
ncbi:MAG TPA: OmpA family protein [Chitinophagaceae bacterium]|nr:OmpA family protein [Chitinophagaceae bacterium]